MKNYTIIPPALDGVLSDDNLYLDGVRRPLALFAVRDGGMATEENVETLEKYFNDIYNLFLRKLSLFATEESTTFDESVKLQALLQEMIKVKALVEAATLSGEEREAD